MHTMPIDKVFLIRALAKIAKKKVSDKYSRADLKLHKSKKFLLIMYKLLKYIVYNKILLDPLGVPGLFFAIFH